MTIFGKLVLAGFLFVIGGGVYYGVTSYVKTDQEIAVIPTQSAQQGTDNDSLPPAGTTTETKPAGKKMAFTEFIKQGGSYKCTVTQTIANMTTNGTVYIHDKMLRGEFSTTVAGQGVDATMIARDGYTYSWTSMMPTKGYKAKITNTEGATGSASAGSSGTYTWNGDQIGDYSCEVWVTDDTKFELPKSVTFSDVK